MRGNIFRQIVCELFPIARRVQNSVNVVKDSVLRDCVVAIVFAEDTSNAVSEMLSIRSGHISNPGKRVRCALLIATGFGYRYRGKALAIEYQLEVRHRIGYKLTEKAFRPNASNADDTVFA